MSTAEGIEPKSFAPKLKSFAAKLFYVQCVGKYA